MLLPENYAQIPIFTEFFKIFTGVASPENSLRILISTEFPSVVQTANYAQIPIYLGFPSVVQTANYAQILIYLGFPSVFQTENYEQIPIYTGFSFGVSNRELRASTDFYWVFLR